MSYKIPKRFQVPKIQNREKNKSREEKKRLTCNLKMLSTTANSVEVVSKPANADQSFTTSPAPIRSDPRFIVPALYIKRMDMI